MDKPAAAQWDYTPAQLQHALAQVGIQAGNIVFCHVCFESLGQPQGCATPEESHAMLLAALRAAVGPAGTLFVPTYTFSACRRELFDVQQTPTRGGPWSTSAGFLEYVRSQPEAVRSNDPIHSVVGVGPQAAALLSDLPLTCFGPDSVQQRVWQAGGNICMLGIGLYEATLIHHAETMAGVPFRYKKLFPGLVRTVESTDKQNWIYDVRILVPNADLDQQRVEQQARAAGICRVAEVGCEFIRCAPAQPLFELLMEQLGSDAWYTVQGPPGDAVALEQARVAAPTYPRSLPPTASMMQMIEGLWDVPRDTLSAGYDAILNALAEQVPLTQHRYPTGQTYGTRLVPERWTCYEGYLATPEGEQLFAYSDTPLHVVSYSLPFAGEVTRTELAAHLHTHPTLPDAVPFVACQDERDWGLCCSQQQQQALTAERYRVLIRTACSYDTLKVGEVVASGTSADSMLICARLCHSGVVNSDLAGVVVGIAALRELLQCRDLHYTYRLLILPAAIGAAAYLDQQHARLSQLQGGIFLHACGIAQPPLLYHSAAPQSVFDRCSVATFKQHLPDQAILSPDGEADPIVSEFAAQGVPLVTLARGDRERPAAAPYAAYGSSKDTLAITSAAALDEMRDLVLAIIAALETHAIDDQSL